MLQGSWRKKGDKFITENEEEKERVYNRRLRLGKEIADQKKKYAKEQQYFPDAPKEPVSASSLIKQQQDILAKNGDNKERKRENAKQIESCTRFIAEKDVDRLMLLLQEAKEKRDKLAADLVIAQKNALDLLDESTEELERNITK